MKKRVLYALCMSAGLLCLPLVSCSDDDKDELTEVIGGGSAGDGTIGDENNNQGDETGGDNGNGDENGENGDNTGDGGDGSVPDSKKHEAVDLGLSVKWATCNVGASSPEKYGGYYVWGETEESVYHDWSTYKYCKGTSDIMTKYCTKSSWGTVDGKTVLDPEDDVAHVKWGGSWRMPTKEEIAELRDNCFWTWTVQNGADGYVVASKSNSNSIFLPVSYLHWGAHGYRGSIWSASLDENYNYYASLLSFDGTGHGLNVTGRNHGHAVRPVTE